MTVSSMMVVLMDVYFLGIQDRIVAFCSKIFNPGVALLGPAIGVTICLKCSVGGRTVLRTHGDRLKGQLAHEDALRDKKTNGLGKRCPHGVVETLGMLLILFANAHLQDGSFLSR